MSKQSRIKVDKFPVTFGNGEIKLAGEILFPNTGSLVPGAVICHGMGSSRHSVEASAQIMANHGVAVLIFDFRGHGSSDGILDGNIVADAIDAWHFLSEFSGVDSKRIGLVGHSMGAIAAILATEKVNPRVLVALSCPPEQDKKMPKMSSIIPENCIKDTLVKEYPRDGAFPWMKGPLAIVSNLWMRISGYRLRVDWQAFFETLKNAKMSTALLELKNCPTLFVHCKGDNLTPYKSALELYEKVKQPKDILLARGGFHSTPLQRGNLRRNWTQWTVSALMAH